MKLEDVYSGEELEHMQFDLERATELLWSWWNGHEVDPDMANYITGLMGLLARDFPELPDPE